MFRRIIKARNEGRNGNMTYYEIYNRDGEWEIWKWTNNGITCGCVRFKVFKTKKGAENWAKKQWNRVIWR